MKLREIIFIFLQISNIISKKHHKVRSLDNSIENILYYKDCNHKSKTTSPPQILRAAAPKQECKMCCTMCCGDECVDGCHQKSTSRQLNQPSPILPAQMSPVLPPNGKRKRIMPSLSPMSQPPIDGRRDYSVTRDYIKSLISQDVDIRKILKDLVSVTMQKVDLMKMINMRRNNINDSEDIDESDYETDL